MSISENMHNSKDICRRTFKLKKEISYLWTAAVYRFPYIAY